MQQATKHLTQTHRQVKIKTKTKPGAINRHDNNKTNKHNKPKSPKNQTKVASPNRGKQKIRIQANKQVNSNYDEN